LLSQIVIDEPEEPLTPGEPPTYVGDTRGGVSAARTGAVLPLALVFLGTILALFSVVYLLRTNKIEKPAQK